MRNQVAPTTAIRKSPPLFLWQQPAGEETLIHAGVGKHKSFFRFSFYIGLLTYVLIICTLKLG